MKVSQYHVVTSNEPTGVHFFHVGYCNHQSWAASLTPLDWVADADDGSVALEWAIVHEAPSACESVGVDNVARTFGKFDKRPKADLAFFQLLDGAEESRCTLTDFVPRTVTAVPVPGLAVSAFWDGAPLLCICRYSLCSPLRHMGCTRRTC